jgi:transposase
MTAYSQDLRKRIVKAVETTGNQTQVAITFQVSRSTVRRLLKLERVDPTLAAKPHPGRQTEIAPENYPALIALLQEQNDLTLAQLRQLWHEQYHQLVSVATMSRLLKRLGWTRKKRAWQPPNAINNTAMSSKSNKLTSK